MDDAVTAPIQNTTSPPHHCNAPDASDDTTLGPLYNGLSFVFATISFVLLLVSGGLGYLAWLQDGRPFQYGCFDGGPNFLQRYAAECSITCVALWALYAVVLAGSHFVAAKSSTAPSTPSDLRPDQPAP